jgi:hypothetical protein
MQQIPQEVCAHGRTEAATSVCVPATLDEVRNNQTKPGHTVTTKKQPAVLSEEKACPLHIHGKPFMYHLLNIHGSVHCSMNQ